MDVAEGWSEVASRDINLQPNCVHYGQSETTKPESADTTKYIDRHLAAERLTFDMLQFVTNHARQSRRGDRSMAAPRVKWEAHDRLPSAILHRIAFHLHICCPSGMVFEVHRNVDLYMYHVKARQIRQVIVLFSFLVVLVSHGI
ncbi:hypothetical protein E4U58_001249 [Claviceps cyperi]|nr:hypothetical protein E4U58_001249 [Claviceps cyperi]